MQRRLDGFVSTNQNAARAQCKTQLHAGVSVHCQKSLLCSVIVRQILTLPSSSRSCARSAAWQHGRGQSKQKDAELGVICDTENARMVSVEERTTWLISHLFQPFHP